MRAGFEDQQRQSRHGCGKHQDNDDREDHGRQHLKHGRYDGVEKRCTGSRIVRDLIGIKPSEASEEIASSRDDNGEEGGNDRALLDIIFTLDRIKFSDHLRQAPGTKRCQNNDKKQCQRIRPEE